MSFKLRSVALAGVLAVGAGATSAASLARTHAPTARAAASCSTGNGRHLGYSYVTKITVTRTSCSTGRSLARHHGKLRGWHCSRKVLARSPVQYDARMSCSSGRRHVTYWYTQNT